MSLRYSLHLRLIHWIAVALVTMQVVLAVLNMLLYEPRPIFAETLVQAHIAVGAVLFLLTVVRMMSRWLSTAPPKSTSPGLRLAAMISHGSLYICLLALPITGYLKLAALGFTVTPFGLVALPVLPLNTSLAQAADRAHDGVATLLGALLSLHIAAVFLHHRLDGRRVMNHMSIRRGQS